MVFGLFRGKIRMRLAWPRERTYRPGDTIPLQVHVRMEGRPKVRGLRVGLVFWQRFRYPDWDEKKEDGTPDYYMTWKEREQWVVQAQLPLPDPLPKHFEKVYRGTLTIPLDVPPAHEGRICQARWRLKVVADRPLTFDDEHDAGLRLVVPPPGVQTQTRFYGQATHPQTVDMRWRLPGLEFVEGDTLEGELHLRAQQAIEGRRLRVTLAVREFIPLDSTSMPGLEIDDWDEDIPEYLEARDIVAEAELAAPFRMQAGETRVVPFRLTVPRLNKPSCTACGEGGSITWMLHGLVDRPWKQDYRVEQEIFVYGGR